MLISNYKCLVHQLPYNLQNAFCFTFYFDATFELLFDREEVEFSIVLIFKRLDSARRDK